MGILSTVGRLFAVALMLIAVAPAFAALRTGYAEFMSFEEDVKRHEHMKAIFARARKWVETHATSERIGTAVARESESASGERQLEIQDLHVLSGPTILASAAQDAVRQWHFKPHYQGAEAVETQAKITVTGAARSGFMTTDQHDLRE